MFECLMYLYENYIHSEINLATENKLLTDELSRAGFQQDAVKKALRWIHGLSTLEDNTYYAILSTRALHSLRVFTPYECDKLDVNCRGFIYFLEQESVLQPDTREMVIERATEIDSNSFSVDDLKWVVLMVLLNLPNQETALSQLEAFMFDESGGTMH